MARAKNVGHATIAEDLTSLPEIATNALKEKAKEMGREKARSEEREAKE